VSTVQSTNYVGDKATDISAASSPDYDFGTIGLYTTITTLGDTVFGLVQATISSTTVARFSYTTFTRAVAEAVTMHCSDHEAGCSGQTTGKSLQNIVVSPVDVIIVRPIAEEGAKLVVTFYVQAAVTERDVVSGKDVQEALKSAKGLQLFISSGFTLSSVSVVSTSPEETNNRELTTGGIIGIIMGCVILLIVGVIFLIFLRHQLVKRKTVAISPSTTVD
jgi:hypothetical protein